MGAPFTYGKSVQRVSQGNECRRGRENEAGLAGIRESAKKKQRETVVEAEEEGKPSEISVVERPRGKYTEYRRERVIPTDSISSSTSSSSSRSCTMIWLVVVAASTSGCSSEVVGCTLLR